MKYGINGHSSNCSSMKGRKKANDSGEHFFQIDEALYLFHQKQVHKYSTFPSISQQEIDKIISLNKGGLSSYECIKMISPNFSISQNIVDQLANTEDMQLKRLILVSTSFAFLNSQSPTPYSLIFSTICDNLITQFDSVLLFALNLITVHRDTLGASDLPDHAIIKLIYYLNSVKDINITELLCSLLVICDRLNPELDEHIITPLINNISSNPSVYRDLDFTKLIFICAEKIQLMQSDFIRLLGCLAKITPNKDLSALYQQIPYYITQKLKDTHTNDIFLPKSQEEPEEQSTETNYILDPLPPEDFEADCVEILNEKQLELMKNVETLINNCYRDVFIRDYIKIMNDSHETPYFADYFAAYIYILKCTTELPSNFLLSMKYVFDPTITLFQKRYTIVNQLRENVFDLLTIFFQSEIKNILLESKNHHLLFAEEIGRIHKRVSILDLRKILDEEIMKVITSVFSYFGQKQTFHQKAWSTMFVFISAILIDEQIALICFSTNSFIRGYLCYGLEPSLSQIIFDNLQRFLSDHSEPKMIKNICLFINQMIFQAENAELAIALKSIAESMRLNRALVPYFYPTVKFAFSYFLSNPSQEILKGILDLIVMETLSNDNFVFTYDEKLEFSKVLNTLDDSELLTSILIALMAQRKAITMQSLFIIKDPTMLLLLFCIKNIVFRDILEFIKRLCEFSVVNCKRCNEAEIDLFLLSIIKNFPFNFYFHGFFYNFKVTEEDIINHVFPLINFIAIHYSTTQLALNYIGLAIPNEDVFPKFAELAFSSFFTLLSQVQQTPEPYYEYMSYSEPIVHFHIDSSHVVEGFSFTCWFYLDKIVTQCNITQPLIFSLTDDSDSSIYLFLNAMTIFCQLTASDGSASVSLASSIPTNEWIMISFIFLPKDETCSILFAINDEAPSLFITKNPHFELETVTFQIGGFTQSFDETVNEPLCYLGPFQFHDKVFTVTDILQAYSQRKFNSGFLYSKDKNHEIKGYRSIGNELNNHVFPAQLAPFFAFPYTTPNNLIEQVIDMISCTKASETFSLIARFLRSRPSSFLTYNMYLRFFSLLDESTNLDLITEILFNLAIWGRSSQLLRIVTHWNNVLFPAFSTYIVKRIPFVKVLALIRLYLWVSERDRLEDRSSEIDINSCRLQMNRLLYQYAQIEITPDDVQNLISHIYTCKDQQQLLFFIALLRDIGSSEHLNQIHYLFSRSNPDVFCETLETVIVLGGEKARHYINCALPRINSHYATTRMFEKLYELYKQYSIVLPIISQLTVLLGQPELTSLLFIDFSDDQYLQISNNSTWFIWPIINILQMKDKTKGIEFIHKIYSVNKNYVTLDNILCFLDLIEISFHANTKEIQLKFLKLICEIDAPTRSDNFKSMIMFRCIRYLFYQLHFQHLLVPLLLLNSPFQNEEDIEEVRPALQIESIVDLIELTKETKQITLFFHIDPSLLGPGGLLECTCSMMKDLKPQDETQQAIYTILSYFNRILRLEGHKKNSLLTELNTVLPRFTKIMEISYQKTFDIVITNMFSDLTKMINSSNNLMNQIDQVTVFISETCIDSCHMSEKEKERDLDLLWNEFQNDQINTVSIWSKIFPASQEEDKSFKISSSFAIPRLRIIPKIGFSKKRQIVVPHPSVFQSKALLYKIGVTRKIYFVAEQTKFTIFVVHKKIELKTSAIRCIFARNPSSVEIVSNDNTYYLDFSPRKTKSVMSKLMSCELPNLICSKKHHILKQSLLDLWSSRSITNFEFLFKLNLFLGRSYRKESLFPVFPAVLTESGKIRNLNEFPIIDANMSKWLYFLPIYRHKMTERPEIEIPSFPSTISDETHSTFSSESSDASEHFGFFLEEASLLESLDISRTCSLFPNQNLPSELLPDFFCCFESFIGIDLPDFCNKSAFDFVYSHRIALEDPKFNIRKWVWSVFKINLDEQAPINKTEYHTKTFRIMPFVAGVCDDVSLYLKKADSHKIIEYNLSIKETITHNNIEGTLVPMKTGFAILSPELTSLHIYPSKRAINIRYKPDFFESSLSCYHDGYVAEEDRVYSVLPGSPNCAYVSESMNIVAVGLKEGGICLFERDSTKFIRIIRSKEIAKKIIITDGLGLVVMHSYRKVTVFTINGSLITSKDIDIDIEQWVSWRNRNGFDFVLLCDTKGMIYSFEAFNLQFSDVLFTSRQKIGILSYFVARRSIVVTTMEGQGFMIPHERLETSPIHHE